MTLSERPYVDADSLPAYHAMTARAERAEAEAERLREALREIEVETCCDSDWSDLRLFSVCEEANVIARKALSNG